MNMNDLGIAAIPTITVVCYLIGMVCKASSLDNKWIPCTVGFVGAILGVAAMLIMRDFPATDFISAAAIGIVSGLAATGVNQVVAQLKK